MRLIPVEKFPKDYKVDCPGCSLTVKGKPQVKVRDLYLETPSHRAIGVREARTGIDWSNLG